MNKQELLQAANMCCLIYWQGMRRLTMMKYKAGDKVRIRKDLTVYGDYGYVADVVPPMLRYAGKVAFIKEACGYDDTYKINIDDQKWWWTDEMFEDDANMEGWVVKKRDAVLHLRHYCGESMRTTNLWSRQMG